MFCLILQPPEILRDFFFWGINSAGRVPALQAGCQEFESPILHLYSTLAQR